MEVTIREDERSVRVDVYPAGQPIVSGRSGAAEKDTASRMEYIDSCRAIFRAGQALRCNPDGQTEGRIGEESGGRRDEKSEG